MELKRSGSFFIVLFLCYGAVAFLELFNVLTVSTNILLGLSMSSLLLVASAVIEDWVEYKKESNRNFYIRQLTVKFLEEKLIKDQLPKSSTIDVVSLVMELQTPKRKVQSAIYPNEYEKMRRWKFTSKAPVVVFSFAVAIFIISPFYLGEVNNKVVVFVTVLAFAATFLDMYIKERIGKEKSDTMSVYSFPGSLVQTIYSDYASYLNKWLYHKESTDFKKQQSLRGEKGEAVEDNQIREDSSKEPDQKRSDKKQEREE